MYISCILGSASERMTLPMDMKKLAGCPSASLESSERTTVD